MWSDFVGGLWVACGSDGNVFGSTKKLGDAMVHSTRHCTSAAHSTHSTHRQGTAAHRENAQGAQMRVAARVIPWRWEVGMSVVCGVHRSV